MVFFFTSVELPAYHIQCNLILEQEMPSAQSRAKR